MQALVIMIARLVAGALIVLWGSDLSPTCARDATGFLYIDCGSNASYIDPVTGIQWLPDAPYITAGKNHEGLDPQVETDYPDFPELRTVRFFDDHRAKNCYSLPVAPNTTYMLRATFLYGNYDKTGKPPTFELSLDASVVERVSTFSFVPAHREFTYFSESNLTFLCLTQIDPQATPFISAIALKPSGSYYKIQEWYLADRFYLTTRTRVNFGGINGSLIRYPQDPYDRYWSPHGVNSSYLQPTTSLLNTLTTTYPIGRWGIYQPPDAVLQSAVVAESGNNITILLLSPDSRPYQYLETDTYESTYLAVHFAELDSSANTTTRQFYTRLPGNSLVALTNMSAIGNTASWFFSYIGQIAGPGTTVSLIPTADSMWGPILNAMELFSIAKLTSMKTVERDAFAIESIKSSMNLTEWSGDPCLPYPYPWVSCSLADQTQPHITAVNLSGYNLKSAISSRFADLIYLTSLSLDSNELTESLPDLSSLINLKTLYLENNKLSGVLPDWLTTLKYLSELLVQNNNFSGHIPAALLSTNYLHFVYSPGNPLLIGAATTLTSSGPSTSSRFTSVQIVATVLGTVVGLGILFAVAYCLRLRYGLKRHGSIPRKERLQGIARAYSLAEIALLTNNFEVQIGKGGFGPVYHGKLPESGLHVAVKVSDASSLQGETEFLNEVSILSRVHHRYLVELVGYCQTEKRQILLYEYMQNGSLHDHLSGNSKNAITTLTWNTRLGIALHAAQGLEYLHTGCRPSLIHRDVKSSNILLDGKYEAKVADFGLTRLLEDEASGVVTSVKGTQGYLDPEYHSSAYLTTKSDVFSFGVVLLELITGSPPISHGAINQPSIHLSDWVRSCLKKGNIDAMVDPALKYLRPNPNHNAVWKVAEIALQCLEHKSINRPTITEVVQALHQAVALQE